MKLVALAAAAAMALLTSRDLLPAEEVYESGGALAGVKLPLAKTQHGEPEGYPGCIPELAGREKAGDDGDVPFTPQNLSAELELYPGSVEHFRSYWYKFLPVRSFFDRQSQLKNWISPEIPGAESTEPYASPLYWVPRHGLPVDTGQKLKPVSVVRCKPTTPRFKLALGELNAGLYAVRVIGAVETQNLRPFRSPLYIALRINDGPGGETNTYRIRCGYVDEFYSLVEIYFHAPEKRSYSAELWVDRDSAVDLLVHNITLDDALAGTIRKPIKQHPSQSARWTNRKLADQGLVPGFRYLRRTPFSLFELDANQPAEASSADAATARPQVATSSQPGTTERLQRDERLWKALPPLNAQSGGRQIFSVGFLNPGYDRSGPNKTAEQTAAGQTIAGQTIAAAGDWEGTWRGPTDGTLADDRLIRGDFIENKKLGLVYTIDDLWQHKRLPEPYPHQDDGAGLFSPHPENQSQGRVLAPIADEVGARIQDYPSWIAHRAGQWKATGDQEAARDAAVALVRFAYQFPALDSANGLMAVANMPLAGCADMRCRSRENCAWWDVNYAENLIESYELLFPLIHTDRELARSIGRFVPWVQTPQDVTQLLDVYLVQTAIKRWFRYHDFFSDPFYGPATIRLQRWAGVLGDEAITRACNDWLKTSMWSTNDNDQRSVAIMELTELGKEPFAKRKNVLSVFNACDADELLDPCLRRFLVAGRAPVEPKLCDLVIPGHALNMGIPLHHLWPVGIRLGSIPFQQDGSYAGRPETLMQECLQRNSALGWSKEMYTGGMPTFLVKNYGKRNLTDAEWARLQTLSASPANRNRGSFDDNSSGWHCSDGHVRVHELCYAALESGRQHDDFRFRRAVYLGVGQSYRVATTSAYAMLLSVCAHGLPMTQLVRAAYNTDRTYLNGVMGVNDVGNGIGSETKCSSYSWVHSMSNGPGVSYLSAETPALSADRPRSSANSGILRAKPSLRQVALVDVDEGDPRSAKSANSYVFDVVRNSGGHWHTYRFTGPLTDALTSNVQAERPAPKDGATETPLFDPQFYQNYRGYRPQSEIYEGVAPATYVATWPFARTGPRSEQEYLGDDFDPTSPQKFARLHVLDVSGMPVLRAVTPIYRTGKCTEVMVQKRGPKDSDDLDSTFTAIVEPFAGEPFIRERKTLPIEGNNDGYLRAVAIEVKTTNGHTDICFSDGRPEKKRLVHGTDFVMAAQGEFAFYSRSGEGFRQAALVGGTSLEGPEVRIAAAKSAYAGTIREVDYGNNTLVLDEPWPRACALNALEIGTPPRCSTTYTVRSLDSVAGVTRLTLHRSADFFRAPIKTLIPKGAKVGGRAFENATLDVRFIPETNYSHEDSPIFGRVYQASNAQRTKFWTAVSPDGRRLELTGADVSEADFAPSGEVILWEYQPGDPVRQCTACSVRHVADSVFEVSGNVDMQVSLKTAKVEASSDRTSWRPSAATVAGEWCMVPVSVADLERGPLYLRAAAALK